jgi:DNA modification methylase
VSIYHRDDTLTLLLGKAETVLPTLEAGAVDCVVTSPPYFGLRDYEGNADQIGSEASPAEYVDALGRVFAEVHRVLADDGTLWLNIGDCYYSGRGNPGPNSADEKQPARRGWVRPLDRPGQAWAKPKDLLGMPWRVTFALQDAGWYLRNAIVWHKPNAMPEPVQDRLSSRHELLFLLTKSRRYWFDLDAIREPLARPEALDRGIVFGGTNAGEGKVGSSARRDGAHRSVYGHRATAGTPKGRNPGDVWSINTRPLTDAHFATFPVELPRRCILAGSRPGGTVLDPFSGAGTTALAAQQLGRRAIGIDINAAYHDIALRRMADAPLPLESEAPSTAQQPGPRDVPPNLFGEVSA